MRSTTRALCLGALVVGGACATTSARFDAVQVVGSDDLEPLRLERRSTLIRAPELGSVQGTTAIDAIRRLRPEFLRSAPATHIGATAAMPMVYLDGRPFGAIEALGGLSLASIREIRYFAPAAARNAFGSYCACDGGVILVATRR